MVSKAGFFALHISCVYVQCNAKNQGDLHRKRHRFVCQFGSDAAVACNRFLNHASLETNYASEIMIGNKLRRFFQGTSGVSRRSPETQRSMIGRPSPLDFDLSQPCRRRGHHHAQPQAPCAHFHGKLMFQLACTNPLSMRTVEEASGLAESSTRVWRWSPAAPWLR